MAPPKKWSMGVLNDPETDEVPGSVLLIPHSTHQEPLGYPTEEEVKAAAQPSPPAGPGNKKKTPDGKFILDPQPDDNPNDPLNWTQWRRDLALLSLGWHCLVGGGQTPVLAAGFQDVADEFKVTFGQVALTTGLFMMGMGIGALISSPLAILYGKRPIYLAGVLIFLAASVWCALAGSYESLVVARIFMGIGIGPCESLPSATIAEIFFLHERAYRVGIYTLLLLGGKNLVPLVSAVVINSMGWRWVFRIVAIIVAFNFFLIFFFVPETFWDRTPSPSKRPSLLRRASSIFSKKSDSKRIESHAGSSSAPKSGSSSQKLRTGPSELENVEQETGPRPEDQVDDGRKRVRIDVEAEEGKETAISGIGEEKEAVIPSLPGNASIQPPATFDLEKHIIATSPEPDSSDSRSREPATYVSSLKVWNGRLRPDPFLNALRRPVILFLYPAILWSTVVYSLSVGWLIVLSESVAHIYQHHPYNFSPLSTGLVYLSPFIGGILGTAIAGKVSDIIVRFMSRRNGGIYEPEFRLVMGLPVALCTAIGLMGFGWSAENEDKWIVPTTFFGVISFGCSLGSTTAITFAVDSYRQFAGEALVTLNFSKNVFHGLVFSLFFNDWLESQGSRRVFIALGGIQLACLVFTVPLYIYGKRLRMWTVRKDFAGRWS